MDFIKCELCQDWSDLKKTEDTCILCKGRGFIRNPDKELCNRCGGNMCPPKPDMNWQFTNGLSRIKVTGDYSSAYLLDEHQYSFSLCECCLRNMFDTFMIPPKVIDIGTQYDISYEADKKTYDYMKWSSDGGFHQAYLNKKCNVVKDCTENAIYTILSNGELYSDFCSCENHITNYRTYGWCKIVPFISNTLKAFV